MTDYFLLFYFLLFLVAFLYSAVGHGGASGYLALMALFSFSPALMKPTALLLNLFVSIVAFFQFYRKGFFIGRIFLPLALASIPMAFLGGMIELEAVLYRKILGLFLIIPVARFLFYANPTETDPKLATTAIALFLGGSIGFFSGLIGIGGGVILSPILLMLRWTDQKQTAAIGSMFIFVNSLAGLSGQFSNGLVVSQDMVFLVLVAFAGGVFGAYFGAVRLHQTILKYILASVLCIASFKLLLT